jgi:hypothetical protein
LRYLYEPIDVGYVKLLGGILQQIRRKGYSLARWMTTRPIHNLQCPEPPGGALKELGDQPTPLQITILGYCIETLLSPTMENVQEVVVHKKEDFP